MKGWLKGGLIGAGAYLLLYIIFIDIIDIGFLGLLLFPLIILLEFIPSYCQTSLDCFSKICSDFQLFLCTNLIYYVETIIIGFIIGILISWIVGKIKSKKQKGVRG
ncbi:hypothetical protein HOD75_04895 [archaeon]|jgi:hypothetical protein|nr:hypothetical protein [archaeon]MBT4242202.1 hypothetical protein [archaeon]MBT4417890.1 hypothetical protein [archaeon]